MEQDTGKGVKVALLDTGVDLTHPNLRNSIAAYADFTGEGIEDLHGHGTHSAGIIAARNNGLGLSGVAPECDLLIAKVLNCHGVGRCIDIAEGVDWAVDAGAHIICLPMSSMKSSPLLYRSITYALAKGVNIICAADSSANGKDSSPGYPARYGSIISVAAVDESKITQSASGSDLTAPGKNIWSSFKAGSFQELSGSSVAATFVTGIASLALANYRTRACSVAPIFNCEDLKSHLVALAEKTHSRFVGENHCELPPFLSADRTA